MSVKSFAHTRRIAVATALMAIAYAGVAMADLASTVQFNIAPQTLSAALLKYSEQAGVQVTSPSELIEGRVSKGVVGELVAGRALDRILEGTGLGFQGVDARTVVIREVKGNTQAQSTPEAATSELWLAQSQASSTSSSSSATEQEGPTLESKSATEQADDAEAIPEILVIGEKENWSLNADIKRTENDTQPYVVLDREKIERSGAASLDEFLKNQLAVNVTSFSANQQETLISSTINIRGLGSDETLILIDGRRAAGFSFFGEPMQTNINGIPLAAIERIDVLPTSASGIYGGGATGGVINIVLRRDYRGLDVKLTYDDTFDGGGARRRVDSSAGLSLEGGRTDILVAGSYEDIEALLIGQRDFARRGRQHVFQNDPGFFLNQFIPPLGATTNVRSVSGDLVLDDGTPLNSRITHVPIGYPGVLAAGDGGAAFLANAGRYNLDLASTAQAGQAYNGLLSAGTNTSLMMTVRREFTLDIQAYLELRGSFMRKRVPRNAANGVAILAADAPNNPFQQNIRVAAPLIGLDEETLSKPEADDHRVVAGIIAKLGKKWQAALDFTWNRSQSLLETASELSSHSQSAVASGQVDILRDLNRFPAEFILADAPSTFTSPADVTLKNASLRVGGALPWKLSGADVGVSILLEHRNEALGELKLDFPSSGISQLFPAREQSVSSAYAEARLPFVSESNAHPGLELLELQLSARADRYKVRGANFIDLNNPTPVAYVTNRHTTIDPTIGLRYKPIRDLIFRTSFATGYLPPSMSQLAPDPSFPLDLGGSFGLLDPLRNELIGEVIFVQGGNPGLKPESSESSAAGVILTPRFLPRLRLSVDWNLTKKKDNIGAVFGFDQASFERFAAAFPDRITRASPGGPIIAVDATRGNAARVEVEAVDFALDYTIETASAGRFQLTADMTHIRSFTTQLIAGAELIESSHTGLKWRGSGGFNWSLSGLDLGWRTRYFDSYYLNAERMVVARQGSDKVKRQIYHDVYGSYRFSAHDGVLEGVEIGSGINNLFNKKPPIDTFNFLGGSYSSRYGDPRLRSFYLSVRKAF